jgi:DNA-binding transcriptional LysR family regulator
VELQELRYVLALAHELNFTRAAAGCHISQQALSRAIARVERRLDEPIRVGLIGSPTVVAKT